MNGFARLARLLGILVVVGFVLYLLVILFLVSCQPAS